MSARNERQKERRAEYSVYLRSAHWVNFRKRYFAARPKICSQCGSGQYVQLHHKTYATLGKERFEDVKPLCRSCHKKLHGKTRKSRRPRKRTYRRSESDVKITYADGSFEYKSQDSMWPRKSYPKYGSHREIEPKK